jgi:antimicrobial peptide system SdpA family protein
LFHPRPRMTLPIRLMLRQTLAHALETEDSPGVLLDTDSSNPCRRRDTEKMELHRPSSRQLRFLATFFLLTTCLWLLVLSYSVHEGMPFNPVKLPLAQTLRVNLLIPQGWRFFTRNPREEFISVFVKDSDGKWQSALAEVNASPVNFFGLNRQSRAQGIEIGMLTASIKRDQWSECRERQDVCIERVPTAASIPNDSPHPTLCGDVILIRQSPTPWAWSKARRHVIMPSKYAKVNLVCSQAL